MLSAATVRAAVRRSVRERVELVVLAVVVLALLGLPGHVITGWKPVGLGVLALGLAAGAPSALHAVGIVLVYRSNRIINFAQVAMGSVGGYLFFEIMRHRQFIVLVGGLGGTRYPDPQYAPLHLQILNLVAAAVIGLVAGPLIGLLVYNVVIRWFERVSPLMVTVVTIVIAGVLPQINRLIGDTGLWSGGDRDVLSLPVDAILTVEPIQLQGPQLLSVVMAGVVAGALALFFRRSGVGIVLRASADNAERARTLGVSVTRMTGVAWLVAGTLSALAAVLSSASGVSSVDTASLAPTLVRILAAAVVARMRSIPVAVGAALALGVVQQALQWNLSSDAIYEAVLLALITVFLLVQRERRGRADADVTGRFPAALEVRPVPAELRGFFLVRRYRRLVVLGTAVFFLGYPWAVPPGRTDYLTVLLVYAMIGLSVLILTGWAGQISLGQFAFAAIGGWTTAVLTAHGGLPAPIAIFAGALAGAVVAVAVGLPALRLPGLYLAVATLALSLATTSILLNPLYAGKAMPTTLSRPTFLGLNTNDVRVFYYITLVLLAVVTGSLLGLRRSRFARALIASRDNEPAALAFGVNLVKIRLLAFALSGFLAALAGGVFAFQQFGVHPPAYGADTSLQQFLATLLGGLGSVWGPIIGQAWQFLLTLAGGTPVLSFFGTGVGLILLLRFYPSGLGGLVFRIRDAVLHRMAVRYAIDVPAYGDSGDVGEDGVRRAHLAEPSSAEQALLPMPVEFRLRAQWSLPGGAPVEEPVA